MLTEYFNDYPWFSGKLVFPHIPELVLVAEEYGKLIGHIMLTTTYIISAHAKVSTLLLATVSVALAYRNMSIGPRCPIGNLWDN